MWKSKKYLSPRAAVAKALGPPGVHSAFAQSYGGRGEALNRKSLNRGATADVYLIMGMLQDFSDVAHQDVGLSPGELKR